MKKRFILCGWLAALAWVGVAQAQVDLSHLDKSMAGPKAQVLVMGTVHLRTMPDNFDPASLQPVLDRLVAFKPDIIAIEAIPGADCYLMTQQLDIYDPASLARFCTLPGKARAATGLTVLQAVAAVRKALQNWPQQPTPAQRRHLASLLMAANADTSAVVQWLQLPASERHAGNGLDTTLVAMLNKRTSPDAAFFHNEFYQIAARVAARLGLQRVYPIDDHTGDGFDVDDIKAYAHDLRQAWASAKAEAAPMRKHKKALIERGDMLALYRYINQPDVMRLAAESDVGAAMREASPPHYYSQEYVAGWETRNLRMVANIRATFRTHPGARVLVIVGSSHKPWFDSLLGQMQGVQIVDAEKILH